MERAKNRGYLFYIFFIFYRKKYTQRCTARVKEMERQKKRKCIAYAGPLTAISTFHTNYKHSTSNSFLIKSIGRLRAHTPAPASTHQFPTMARVHKQHQTNHIKRNKMRRRIISYNSSAHPNQLFSYKRYNSPNRDI